MLLAAVLAACDSSGTGASTCTAKCTGSEYTFCESGSAKKITCKGPMGCTGTTCDTSNHTAGDGCQAALYRCDPANGVQVLQCVGNVLEPFRSCSGPRQCYFEGTTLGCDSTIGDTCPAAYEARYFCDSIDTQQVLTCRDGGVAFYSKCSGVKNCGTADGGGLSCL
jgi:hypothetical protein